MVGTDTWRALQSFTGYYQDAGPYYAYNTQGNFWGDDYWHYKTSPYDWKVDGNKFNVN